MNLKQLLRHHRIKIYGAIAILGLGSITLYHMPREENVSAPKTIETEEPAIPEKQNVAPELVLDSSVKTLTEEQKILLQQNISLSNNQYLNQKIRNYKVDYPYSEYFGIDQALQAYHSLPEYVSEHGTNVIKNGVVDESALYECVLANQEQLKENQTRLDDTTLRQICKIITDTINATIMNEGNYDLGDLNYKLSHLIVAEYKEFSYAYYNPAQNTLGINKTSIYNLASSEPFDDVLKQVIAHETEHLLQAGSALESQERNYVMRFGPCVEFGNLKVNSLYWNWFIEGSAESLALKTTNREDTLTYPQEVKGLEIVQLANNLSQNGSLEKLSLQSNLENVYSYFQCNTDEDKKEILEFMYAMNLVISDSYTSSSEDFYTVYKEANNGNMIDRASYKTDLKESIAMTLTKQFYGNFVNYASSGTYNLEQLMHMMSIYEDELSRLLWYSNSSYRDSYIDFFEFYTQIQSLVFEQIAQQLGRSQEEIVNLYITYHLANEKGDLSFLPSEQQQFYEYIASTRQNDHKNAIIDVYQQMSSFRKK